MLSSATAKENLPREISSPFSFLCPCSTKEPAASYANTPTDCVPYDNCRRRHYQVKRVFPLGFYRRFLLVSCAWGGAHTAVSPSTGGEREGVGDGV